MIKNSNRFGKCQKTAGGEDFLTHTVGNGDRCCNFHNPVECYNINVLLTLLAS